MRKYLIIDANDLSYAQGVNHGVISAYEQELMLSTNLKDKKRQSYS